MKNILTIFILTSFDPTKHLTKLANGEKSNSVASDSGAVVIYLHSTNKRLVKILSKNTLLVTS